MKVNLKALRYILILLAAVLAFGGLFAVLRTLELRSADGASDAAETAEKPQAGPEEEAYPDSEAEEGVSQLYRNGKWYQPNRDLETVLLIGVDKFEEAVSSENAGYTNDQQADFLLLLLLDHGRKSCQAVHINRDTMAQIRRIGADGRDAGTVTKQLALAHTYGRDEADSCGNTAEAVSGFLYGVPVDHFVSVTMDAVPAAVDLAGGVPVTLTDDLTAVDPSMKKGATVCLSGEAALRFVRARGELEDSTNVSRMERQRQFMEAFRETFAEKQREEETLLTDLFVSVAPFMVTDCSVEELERIGTCAAQYGNKGIRTVEGEAVKGTQFMEFYADEEKLKELVLELFYEEAGTGSA